MGAIALLEAAASEAIAPELVAIGPGAMGCSMLDMPRTNGGRPRGFPLALAREEEDEDEASGRFGPATGSPSGPGLPARRMLLCPSGTRWFKIAGTSARRCGGFTFEGPSGLPGVASSRPSACSLVPDCFWP